MNRMRHYSFVILATCLIGASSADLYAATFSDDNWTSMGGYPGANGEVYATAVDGSGNLYIGGEFAIAGGVFATNIAKWDGTNWSALGSGLQGDDGFGPIVYALVMSGTDLYAAGHFTLAGGVRANSIAKWNGTNWAALGSGITGGVCCGGQIGGAYAAYVYALAASGNDLYASGYFTIAGGNTVNYIAKWNGSSWSALGSGLNGGAVSLAVSGNDLYVGGYFTNAGGIAVNRIAKWNGSTWSALGSGVEGFDYWGNPDSYVSALAASGNDLYVAGNFSTAGGIATTNMAKWNGSSWSAFAPPIFPVNKPAAWGIVNRLAFLGDELYAAVDLDTFTSYDTAVVKWNGTNWLSLEPGPNWEWIESGDPHVYALAVWGTNVYAGGGFREAGNKTAYCIAKWNGSNWSALAPAHQYLTALTASGRDVYGAGSFAAADGTQSNYVAKWNGSGWSPLGTGMVSGVSALAVSGNDLYAGGSFTNVAGISANGIARWDGTNWSALSSGINGDVYALAVSGQDLYAAGWFTTAGEIAANSIAKWNGTNWSALGPGLQYGQRAGAVNALAVSGSDLYAAGAFTSAGGSAAMNIAKRNGSSWSALGSGLGFTVWAMAVSGNDVYAGGVNSFQISKWNGSNWSAIGSFEEQVDGEGPDVWALAASGTDLYVGGWFTSAGAGPNIVKWDGSRLQSLGSGVNGSVHALAVTDTGLFVAGGFATAGGKISPYLARARIGSIVKSVAAANSTASIQLSGVTGYQYDVQRATNLNSPITWTTITASPLSPASDGSFIFTDTNAPPGTAYYRAAEVVTH